MSQTSTYHPIQSFRHLCNRLDSNNRDRDAVISSINEKRTLIKQLELEISRLENSGMLEVKQRRDVLLEEGRELLPQLQGFKKCFEQLKALVS